MKQYYWQIFYLLFLFVGCKAGSEWENQKPETKIFLDEITLTGGNRLNSVVKMHWTGEDVDGYVQKYEFSLDGGNSWQATTQHDSTFRFSIASGSDTLDIDFYVRAVDNKDARDASPAFLKIPLKNTPPVVKLDATKPIPDTVFSVFSFLWTVSDLDGVETVDSIFIKANQGDWYPLPKNTNFCTIVPESPKIAGSQAGKCYKGLSGELLSQKVQGLEVNALNRIYIKVKDIAGSFSDIDSGNVFFLQKQTGDMLVIDEYAPTSVPLPELSYFPVFQNLGVSYDLYDLYRLPPPYWQPTLQLWFSLYDKVFWYSEGKEYATFGNQMYLEVAAASIQSYLNQGGKLWVSAKFPPRFNVPATAYGSPIFTYSPFDSLSTSSGFARLWADSLVYPVNSFTASFPNLKPSASGNVDAAYAKNPSQNLYEADLQKNQGWTGPSTICGTTKYTNNRTNQVFFTVDMNKLDGNPAEFQEMCNKILNQEFDW